MALLLVDGVAGRFLYAEAGNEGGPIVPGATGVEGASIGGGDFKAAAAITSRWSAGNGGSGASPPRDRILEELPGRRGVLLGDAGGDKLFSTPAAAIAPEYLWLRDKRSRSICSADTMVCVPSSEVAPSICLGKG